MYIVARGHSVTLSNQHFKSGALLPNNRDYSTLIDMGVVVQMTPTKPAFPTDEPSIVTITRNKVKNIKATQASEKKQRAVAKKKASAKKKTTKKKKKFSVESGG